MAASYLLEKRGRFLNEFENCFFWSSLVGTALLALGFADSLHPFREELWVFGSLCIVGPCLCVFFQIWMYSSLWLTIRGITLEELTTTRTRLSAMVDEVTFYTLKRVSRVIGIPIAFACPNALARSWYVALVTALVLLVSLASLSYLVQAWCTWSSLAWYCALLGIPVLFQLLVALASVVSGLLGEAGVLFGIAAMVLLPRALAISGFRGHSVSKLPVRSLVCKARRPKRLVGGNPIVARHLLRMGGGQGFLTVACLLMVAGWWALDFDNLHFTCDSSQDLFLTGLLGFFLVSAVMAFSQVKRERSQGTLTLTELTALSPSEVTDGLSWSACVMPVLMLLALAPGMMAPNH